MHAANPPGTEDPDLAVCDREALAFSGRIQDQGALLVCDGDGTVTHASDNLQRFFDCNPAPGLTLQALFADDSDYFVHRRRAIHDAHHFVIHNVLSNRGLEGDLLLSECAGRLLYEFEARAEPDAATPAPQLSISGDPGTLPAETDPERLLRQIHELTRYPKIMIYRFLEDHSGEVVAELSDGSLDAYLGLRFPASDIPRNARNLYVDNPFRLIFDTAGPTVAVRALQRATDDTPPDLSTSTLRSVSPLHLEYLGNMGVRASCSFSVRVMGRLWGLVALHATQPTQIDVRSRIRVRELIDRHLALALMNAHIRAGHQRFNSSVGLVEGCAAALAALLRGGHDLPLDALRELLDCDSLLLLRDGMPLRDELDLAPQQWRGLRDVARRQRLNGQFATDFLGRFLEQDAPFRQRVSGVLYQSIGSGRAGSELEILWLRQEQIRTVSWAGEPLKLRREVDGEVRISPRRSFQKWSEETRGQSRPWNNADRLLATRLAAQALSAVAGIARGSTRPP